jgi:hypothetical protein
MNIETDLKHALRRKAPPPGFADRVIARIEREPQTAPVPRRNVRRPLAAAALLGIIVSAWGAHTIIERRRAEGEHAREQVLLAMRIASSKVAQAQHEVMKEKP